MTQEQKIKELTKIARSYSQLAGELWELADAYAGGQSEFADEMAKRMDRLDAAFDRLLQK